MSENLSKSTKALCPSAQPEWPGTLVIGIVAGTADEPRVMPLDKPLPVTDELLALSNPVTPTEVFRFAAPCACKACPNFEDDRCALIQRIVRILPRVTNTLPACEIRPHCRWWQEEGEAACLRCPQVVTENYNPSPL
ncbi:MAG TPA: hypothetical protein VGO69_04590, partial [Pyrinomonadaceae bacterium]|nr:hypothetical protein [Pyrinomonadaceae bacterium]